MFTVTGKGIICKEPELRYTTNGTPVCHATAVNNEEYNGEKTGHFTNLVLFGERAESFVEEVSKGCLIEITQSILKHPTRTHEGKTYYNTEVTVLEWEVIQKFEPKPPAKHTSSSRQRNTGNSSKRNIGNSSRRNT